MRRHPEQIATILLFLFFFAFRVDTADAAGLRQALRTSDGKIISLEQMAADIRKADIVFVGESHNDKRHHDAQLSIIRALANLKVPLAIGIEMFRANSQKDLDRWTEGAMSLDTFKKVYYDNWDISWPLYANIFLYARDSRIPMVGLNVPPEITRKVSREGFSSLTAGELKQLPPGISCDVDDQYRAFIRKAYEAHHGGAESFSRFCEAQMIWDKAMAWRLVNYLKANRGKTVVALAGTGHSWKRGIPEQVRKISDYRTRVILPEIPDRVSRKNLTSEDADYILLQ